MNDVYITVSEIESCTYLCCLSVCLRVGVGEWMSERARVYICMYEYIYRCIYVMNDVYI